MVMQARVLISLVTDAMLCASGTCQQRRGGTAVQVINDVVVVGAQLTRNTRARRSTLALESNDIIRVWKSVEHGRHPVFEQNIDARVRQESFKREEGRSCQHRVADGTQAHKENSLDAVPVPDCRGKRLWILVFTAQALLLQSAQLRR